MRECITKCFFVFLLIIFSNRAVSQSSGMLSFTLDPKMLAVGPYETSEYGELDLTIRLGCSKERFEIGLYTELFPAIGYYGFGLFSNYKFFLDSNPKTFHRWVVPIGGELGFIRRVHREANNLRSHRDKVLQFNFGFIGSVRYFIIKNMALELGVDYRYRSDLEKIYQDDFQLRANVFTGIVFTWP